jgi:hypothetical protein
VRLWVEPGTLTTSAITSWVLTPGQGSGLLAGAIAGGAKLGDGGAELVGVESVESVGVCGNGVRHVLKLVRLVCKLTSVCVFPLCWLSMC